MVQTDPIPKDILLYSPFDSQYKNVPGLDEEMFFAHFFSEYEKLQVLKNDFKKYLSSTNEKRTPILVLSGYSGCGKTTFINWLKRDLVKENNYFKIISLTEQASIGNNEILIAAIRKDLIQMLKNSRTLKLINENLDYFVSIFSEMIKSPDLTDDPVKVKLQVKSKLDEIEGLYEKLKLYEGNQKLILISDFTQKNCFEFKDLLFIYLLENILEFQESSTPKQDYIFCFDNLDEMKYEYISKKMWDDITEVWNALSFICNSREVKVNFPFETKFHLILVFRESNISLSNLENPQTYDRMFHIIKKRRVILSGEVDDILDRRLKYIKNNLAQFYESSDVVKLFRYLRRDNTFTKKVLLPFFNYDYRKLFLAIEKLTDKDENENRLFYLNKEDIENINDFSKISEYKYITRGIILHPLIVSACREQLRNLITNKSDGCRLSRLILTVLYNLTYPDGLPPEDNFQRDEIQPRLLEISTVFKLFSKRYEVDDFIDNLLRCYNFSSERWANLISLYNIKVDRDTQKPSIKNKTIELLSAIGSQSKTYRYDEKKETFIHFNASGFIYLRYLITHFEYFSFLDSLENTTIENAPLINLAFRIHTSSGKLAIFGFEKKIDDVLALVKEYKKNIDISYEIKFPDLTPQKYIKSKYTFGETVESKRFYITRVVTTHIRYIDDFRRFIYFSEKFKHFLLDKKKSGLVLKNEKEINDYLVKRISDYLAILETGIKDSSIWSTLTNLKEKVTLANEAYAKGEWLSIATTANIYE
ncbi:ATP-binding protein [Ferruginibacter sp.]|nr:hypothetical protein [Ferruginibacter sp.]